MADGRKAGFGRGIFTHSPIRFAPIRLPDHSAIQIALLLHYWGIGIVPKHWQV